jgi:hypothetical protein
MDWLPPSRALLKNPQVDLTSRKGPIGADLNGCVDVSEIIAEKEVDGAVDLAGQLYGREELLIVLQALIEERTAAVVIAMVLMVEHHALAQLEVRVVELAVVEVLIPSILVEGRGQSSALISVVEPFENLQKVQGFVLHANTYDPQPGARVDTNLTQPNQTRLKRRRFTSSQFTQFLRSLPVQCRRRGSSLATH